MERRDEDLARLEGHGGVQVHGDPGLAFVLPGAAADSGQDVTRLGRLGLRTRAPGPAFGQRRGVGVDDERRLELE